MAHFIIVEGPDGAGKSTLVESLKKVHTNSIVIHFGAPCTEEEAYNYWQKYASTITQYAGTDHTVIFDRSWISDMVYAPIMRNRVEMSEEHADMLNALVIAAGGGMIIYCTASQSTLWRRCRIRGEDYIKDASTLNEIVSMYSDVMRRVKYLPVIRFDTGAQW